MGFVDLQAAWTELLSQIVCSILISPQFLNLEEFFGSSSMTLRSGGMTLRSGGNCFCLMCEQGCGEAGR